MPSPFPGMDPYLEIPAMWPSLHHWLISAVSHQLRPKLRPRGYLINVGERVWVSEPGCSIYLDATVVERPPLRTPTTWSADEEAGDQPVLIKAFETETREPFLEIVDSKGGRLVTGIEVLSPVNKSPGPGQELYRQKQQEVLESRSNLVEIDLLRSGRHTLSLPESSLDAVPAHNYLVCVIRAGRRAEFEIYPVSLPSRLPRVGVPLNAGDADVILDLQEALDYAYVEGAFDDRIDYLQPPPGHLSSEAIAWCEETVRKART